MKPVEHIGAMAVVKNKEIGVKVQIRKWDDMAKEFGTDSDNDILTRNISFTQDLEKELPSDRIIDIKDGVQLNWKNEWVITDDMIEKILLKGN